MTDIIPESTNAAAIARTKTEEGGMSLTEKRLRNLEAFAGLVADWAGNADLHTAARTLLMARIHGGAPVASEPAIPAGQRPYLSDRFEWAAPGDQQEDAWIVRFCDRDVRDMLYTGLEAEAEARAAWERHAPGYNMYLFRLARLAASPANTPRSVDDIAACCCTARMQDYTGQVELVPPAHQPRGDGGGICVDACLALEVTRLWARGITTTGCCCGHRIAPAYIGVTLGSAHAMLSLGYKPIGDEGTSFVPMTGCASRPVEREVEAYRSDGLWWLEIAEGKGYDSITAALEAAPSAALARPVEAGAGKLAEAAVTILMAIEAHCRNEAGLTGVDHADEGQRIRRGIQAFLADPQIAALTTPAGGIAEGGHHG